MTLGGSVCLSVYRYLQFCSLGNSLKLKSVKYIYFVTTMISHSCCITFYQLPMRSIKICSNRYTASDDAETITTVTASNKMRYILSFCYYSKFTRTSMFITVNNYITVSLNLTLKVPLNSVVTILMVFNSKPSMLFLRQKVQFVLAVTLTFDHKLT